LEDVISRHPAVSEVCVVGVPDPETGSRIPRAFVTKRKGFEDVSSEMIAQFANGERTKYMYWHLRNLVFAFPMSVSIEFQKTWPSISIFEEVCLS
jgi:acyl-coenzyme A synthetase/AMP-(fatty) acid ligase